SRRRPLLDETLRAPFDAELARRTHVAEHRGRRDDRGAREIAEAADAHAVRPVAVERRDRGLPLRERVGALAEAGPAPRFADLAADRAEHVGDRLAAEARVGPFDVLLHAARAGEDDELVRRALRALVPRAAQDKCGLDEIAVCAVGARSGERPVERDGAARALVCP